MAEPALGNAALWGGDCELEAGRLVAAIRRSRALLPLGVARASFACQAWLAPMRRQRSSPPRSQRAARRSSGEGSRPRAAAPGFPSRSRRSLDARALGAARGGPLGHTAPFKSKLVAAPRLDSPLDPCSSRRTCWTRRSSRSTSRRCSWMCRSSRSSSRRRSRTRCSSECSLRRLSWTRHSSG